MKIVFIGKPGSGKGTQAKLLSSALSIPHLSSGEILRREVKEQTELGKKVESFILRGEIGPEELIARTIISFIKKNGYENSYILDGFPRTSLQADILDSSLPPDIVIYLDVDDGEVVNRLSKRLFCPSCEAIYHENTNPPVKEGTCNLCGTKLIKRKDDTPPAIKKRLELFRKDVLPIVESYKKSSRLRIVNGADEPSNIHQEILKITTKDWKHSK